MKIKLFIFLSRVKKILQYLFTIRFPTIQLPHTYVIHYTPLTERKKSLTNKIAPFIHTVDWIEEYDRDVLSEDIIQEKYDKSPQSWNKKLEYANYPLANFDFRLLSSSEISLSFKQFEAIQRVAHSQDDYALILEDDAIFKSKNNKMITIELTTLFSNLPQEWDVIFIGGGFTHKIIAFRGHYKQFWLANNPATNCASSFLISKQFAQKIGADYTFTLPFDLELSYLIAKYDATVYHYLPYIMGQGSVSGKFISELR